MSILASLKRLTKHSAIYGIGHIISRVVNFLLLPLYTNQLPAAEFGAQAVVYAFLAVMTIIYTYGIDAAFLRYFILSDDPNKRRRVFSTAFWAVFIVAIALTCGIYNYDTEISALLISEGDYSHLIRLTSLILLFDALSFLPFLFLRAEERSVSYTVLKFANVVINVMLNLYYLLYLNKGVEGILLANAWASGLTFLILSYILLRNISFQFSLVDFKALASFGLPFLPSTLSVVLLDLIDRPLMEKLAGLDATGVYNAGAKLGMFMALLVTAFRFAWHPFFLSTSKQDNAKEVFSKVLTYFTTLGAFIFLCLSFFIEDIARLNIGGFSLIGEAYWDGIRVVPLILLSYVFYGMYVNFVVGIYLKEKTKYLPLITIVGTIANIVVNLMLIPRIGIMGAGWARLVGHLSMCVMLYFAARRFYKVDYEFARLLKLGAIVMPIFFIGYNIEGIWEIATKVGLLLAMPLLLYGTGFFEKREMVALKSMLNLNRS